MILFYEKRRCFICNIIRGSDPKQYNCGGLGRCTEERAAANLLSRQNMYLQEPEHCFFDAAKRLQILQGGSGHDLFAINVYYHQSCYLKFTVSPVLLRDEKSQQLNDRTQDVLDEFYAKIKSKILHQKNAYLLNKLLKDVATISEEQGIEPPIIHTSTLKMIRRKIASLQSQERIWPYKPEDVLEMLDTGPLQEIYNVVFASIDPSFQVNKYGYAVTKSRSTATKIWSIASDWQALLVKDKLAKQTVAGMTIHRLTANKEVVSMLHKLNNTISYHEIRMQNKAWSRMVSGTGRKSISMMKGIPTHATIDNNDGRQETMTGKGTSHDSNRTLSQPLLPGEQNSASIDEQVDTYDESDEDDVNYIPDFHIGPLQPPSIFKSHVDDKSGVCLTECFKRILYGLWSMQFRVELHLPAKSPMIRLVHGLLQFRVDQLTSNFQRIDETLEEKLQIMKKGPSPDKLEELMKLPALHALMEQVLQPNERTESKATIA
eukprot:gene1897-2154_t